MPSEQSGTSTSGTERICIDLFAGLGGFSSAFEESDEWTVYTVEINDEFDPDLCADIYNLRPSDLLDLVGLDREQIDLLVVLASPPCPEFSTAGNHDHWDFDARTPTHPDARQAIALVYHTLGLIHALAPDYWYLENPQGRLRWFLGEPTGQVTYCQYGRPYMKRTDLWGDHPPMTYRRCQRGSKCHEANVEYDGTSATRLLGETKAERSKVPTELSESIREAVDDVVENPPPEQTTLLARADGGNTCKQSTGTDHVVVCWSCGYTSLSRSEESAARRSVEHHDKGASIDIFSEIDVAKIRSQQTGSDRSGGER